MKFELQANMKKGGTLHGQNGVYKLLRKLGSGGNGQVWIASGPEGEVALKILKARSETLPDAAARFVREVEALKRLASTQGVLPLLDTIADPKSNARHWYTMPIATPLRKKLGNEPTSLEVCGAIAGIASVLANVHSLGISHRDIKPDNLYWHNNGWSVGDFGLAHFEDAESLTRSGRKLGPAYYIAPEMLNTAQIANCASAYVYSLGKTLWILLTGQNYPMPGVHDPWYPGISVGTYFNDWRTVPLDELLRQMTQNDPKSRPDMAKVSSELSKLSPESNPQVSTSETAFERLRAAIAPHQSKQQSHEQQIATAKSTIRPLEQKLEDIAGRIDAAFKLGNARWWPPDYWGHKEALGNPQVSWKESKGFAFQVESAGITYRLAVGAKYQLLSNNSLYVTAGYELHQLARGRQLISHNGSGGWYEERNEANGLPSCSVAIEDLSNGLEKNLSDVLDAFAAYIGRT